MGSSSTTTQNNKPYEAAQPLIDQGLADAQAMYNSGGFNIQPYSGNLVADYDPFRAAADAFAPNAVRGAMGAYGAASTAAQNLTNSDWYTQGLRGVADNVIADVMPAINATFSGAGRTGGGLHEQNLAKGLTAGISDAYYGAYGDAQDRSLRAAGILPELNTAAFSALDYLSGRGEARQGYEQDLIAADVMQDQQAKTADLAALQDYLALSTGAGSQFGVQSSTTSKGGGILGALGFGLQAAPLIWSDRRLKEDIKRVGTTDDGLGVYTYRYKGSDTVHMGVMADEVERIHPDAVAEINGHKAVNYGAL